MRSSRSSSMRKRPRPIRLISSKERMGEYSRCYSKRPIREAAGVTSAASAAAASAAACARGLD